MVTLGYLLLNKGQCLCECVCYLYKSKLLDGSGRNLAWRWSSRAGRFLGGGQPGTPHPLGTECIKGVHNLATFWAILGKIGQLFTHHLVTLVVNNFGAGIVAKMTFITKSRYAIFTIYLHFADNFLNWSQCHTLEPCSSGYG